MKILPFKYILHFFVFLLIATNLSLSDDMKRHWIGIGAGISEYAIRDHVISPLLFSGWGIPLHMYFQYEGERNIYSGAVYFYNIAATSAGDHSADNYFQAIQLGYERTLRRILQDRGSVRAGVVLGIVHSNFNVVYTVPYYRFTTQVQTDSELLHISFRTSIRYQINRGSALSGDISLPLIGYAYRPSYTLGRSEKIKTNDPTYWDELKSGEFLTLKNIKIINSTFSYKRSLSRSVGLGIEHSIDYLNIQRPRRMSIANNKLSLTAYYQFGDVK